MTLIALLGVVALTWLLFAIRGRRRQLAELRARAGVPQLPRRARRAAHKRTARRMWEITGTQRQGGRHGAM